MKIKILACLFVFASTCCGQATFEQAATTQMAVATPTVAPVVILTTSPIPNCTQGSAYLFGLTATGGVSPYTWSLYSGSLQPGLSLSSSGVLSGNCSNASGTVTFAVEACDAESPAHCALPQTLQQTAQSGSSALSVCDSTSSPTCPNPPNAAVVGTFYDYNFNGLGGVPPYTWAISAGALPNGLSLSSPGALTGFPSATGVFSFTVQITDSLSATATAPFSITVTGFTGAPQIAEEVQNWVTAYQGGQNLTTGNPCAITDAAGTCTRNLPKLCTSGNNCKHEQLGFGTNDHPATLAGLAAAGCDWDALAQNQYLWVEVATGANLSGSTFHVTFLDSNPIALYTAPVKVQGYIDYNCSSAATNTPVGPWSIAVTGNISAGAGGPMALGETLQQASTAAEAIVLFIGCSTDGPLTGQSWYTYSGSLCVSGYQANNQMIAAGTQTGHVQVGQFQNGTPDGTHLWTGLTSGATFTPAAAPAANGYFRLTGQCSTGGSNVPCNNLPDQIPCYHSILDSAIVFNPQCTNDLPSMFTIEATALTSSTFPIIEQDGDNTALSGFEVTEASGANQSMDNALCNYYYVGSSTSTPVNCGQGVVFIETNCGACGRDHYYVHGRDPGDPAGDPSGDPGQQAFSATVGNNTQAFPSYPVDPTSGNNECPGWAYYSTYLKTPPAPITTGGPGPITLVGPQLNYSSGCGDDSTFGINLHSGGYTWDEYGTIQKVHKSGTETHDFQVGDGAVNLNQSVNANGLANGNGFNGPEKFAQMYLGSTSEGLFVGGVNVQPINGVMTDFEARNFRAAVDPGWRYITGSAGHSPMAYNPTYGASGPPPAGYGCGLGVPPSGTNYPEYCPFTWALKKNLEFKWCLRCTIDAFIAEGMWPDGQTGESIIIDPRVCSGGQDCLIVGANGLPMVQDTDLRFTHFINRMAAATFSISPRALGSGDGGGVSQGGNRWLIQQGLIYNMDQNEFGGSLAGMILSYGSAGNIFSGCSPTRSSNVATLTCPIGTLAPNPLSAVIVGPCPSGCPIAVPSGTAYVNFNGEREDPVGPVGAGPGTGGTAAFSGTIPNTSDPVWQAMIGGGSAPIYDCRTMNNPGANCTNTLGSTNIWAPMCSAGQNASSMEIGSACQNCGISGNYPCPPFGCGNVACTQGSNLGGSSGDQLCNGVGPCNTGVTAAVTIQTLALSIVGVSAGDIVGVTGCGDASFNTPTEPTTPNIYAATNGVAQSGGSLAACSPVTPTATQNAGTLTVIYPNCGPNVSTPTTSSCQVNNALGFQRNFVVDHIAGYSAATLRITATSHSYKTQMLQNQITNSIFFFGGNLTGGNGIYCNSGCSGGNEASNPAGRGAYATWDQQSNQIHHNVFLLPTATRAEYYTAVGLQGSTLCGPSSTYVTTGNCATWLNGSTQTPISIFCTGSTQPLDANGIPECLGLSGWMRTSSFPSSTFNGTDCNLATLGSCPLISPPWGTFDYHNFSLHLTPTANFFNTAGTDQTVLGPCLTFGSTGTCVQGFSGSIISIDNALSRKQYICAGACGLGPWPD